MPRSRSRRILPRRILRACLMILAPYGLGAQQPDSTRPAPVVMWRDAGIVGGGALLAALVHRADLNVRNELRSSGWQRNRVLQAVSDIGNPWGDPGTVIVGLGLWLGGRAADRPVAAVVGFRALEAVAVSGVITQVAKSAIGRARPRVAPDDAWDVEWWRGWSVALGDYTSLPSGHATAAFAFAAAATDELTRRGHPRARFVGITTYSLATMTGYARMHRDAHWFSDVTMGAAIGIASGLAVTRWHATRPGNRVDALFLGRDMAPFIASGADGTTRFGARVAWQ